MIVPILALIVGSAIGAGIIRALGSSSETIFNRPEPDVPTFTCASLPEDTVGRLTGTVRKLDGVVVAPGSGRECVLYRWTAERLERGVRPRFLGVEQECVPFMLVDESGCAIVDASAAEVELVASVDRSPSFWGTKVNDAERALIQKQGGDTFEARIIECVIAEGDRIIVLGAGVREPDPDRAPDSYRGEMPTRLRVVGSPKHPIHIRHAPRARR